MYRAAALAVASCLALAACDRSEPPSERLASAVEEAVEEVGAAATAEPSQSRFAPRDECGDVAGAAEFRAQLEAAVEARDADALAALASEDILLDFGGGSGRSLLRQRLSDPDCQLWSELEKLLPLGCAPSGEGGITLPWHFAQDFGAIDPYSTYIALGSKVPLYVKAEGDAVVRYLDWEPVTLAAFLEESDASEEGPRSEVILPDKERGFVERRQLRSLIDYRILAGPTERGWRMRVFIAGD